MVKWVENGKVFIYINQQIKVGDKIFVMFVDGWFYIELDVDQCKDYYFFGVGSGIILLMFIFKMILEEEFQSIVYLLYGNCSEEIIIFRDVFDGLQCKYEGQLFVEYILSQFKWEKVGGVLGFFKKSKVAWEGCIGCIDFVQVQWFFSKYKKCS